LNSLHAGTGMCLAVDPTSPRVVGPSLSAACPQRFYPTLMTPKCPSQPENLPVTDSRERSSHASNHRPPQRSDAPSSPEGKTRPRCRRHRAHDDGQSAGRQDHLRRRYLSVQERQRCKRLLRHREPSARVPGLPLPREPVEPPQAIRSCRPARDRKSPLSLALRAPVGSLLPQAKPGVTGPIALCEQSC